MTVLIRPVKLVTSTSFRGLALIALLALPLLAGDDHTLTVAVFFLLLALTVLGLVMLLGFGGQISMATAGLFGLGAYASAILSTRYGMPFVVALPAATLMGGIVGFALALPAVRLQGHYLAIATFAFAEILQSLFVQWNGMTGGFNGIPGIHHPAIFGLHFDSVASEYWLIAAVTWLSFIAADLMITSRFGRALRALSAGEFGARSIGVNTTLVKAQVFGVSSAYTALAGAFYAHFVGFISPEAFGTNRLVEALSGVAVGGFNVIWGAMVGALTLTVAGEYFSSYGDWQFIIYGGVIVGTILIMPRGIIPSLASAGAKARALASGWVSLIDRRSRFHWFAGLAKLASPAATAEKEFKGSLDSSTPATSLAVRAYDWASRIGKHEVTADGPTLEVLGLHKSFGGVPAVAGVSFQVKPSSITALIGPNGAGKTTVLNMISRFIDPDSGRILLSGDVDLLRRPSHRLASLGITRTFQLIQLFQAMTVLENVMAGCYAVTSAGILQGTLRTPGAQREERWARERALDALRFMGIEDLASRLPGELPLGHQRLVEVARAIVTAPRLLLLDEPASGLHGADIERLGETLRTICQGGVAVLLVEHNMSFVMGIADRIVVLDSGEKIAEGPPDIVREDARVLEAYLGA